MDRMTKSDKAVINAFMDHRGHHNGTRLQTDGKRLDIISLGGNGVAYWKDGKVHLPDTGSRSGQYVQRWMLRNYPENDFFNGRGWNPRRHASMTPGAPEPKFGVGDEVERKDGSQRGRVTYVHPHYDEVIQGYRYRVEDSHGTKTYWNEGGMRKVRRNPGGRHIECGSEISDKDCRQLQHVYESARDRGYSAKRSAQQAWGSLRRNPRGSKQLIKVRSYALRSGMIVQAPEYVHDFFEPGDPKVAWQDWPTHARTASGWQGEFAYDFPDPMPTRLRVDAFDEDEDGESALVAIDNRGRELGVTFDWNVGAYPDDWLVEAESLRRAVGFKKNDPEFQATLRQGVYPPDYEGNRMKNSASGPFDRVPSTKKLAEAFRLDTATAKKVHAVLQGDEDTIDEVLGPSNVLSYQSGRMPARHLAMQAANKLLEMHGVEVQEGASQHNFSYLNSGDSYNVTLLFRGRRVWISTWGDEMEALERRGIRFGDHDEEYNPGTPPPRQSNPTRQRNPSVDSRAASLSRRIGGL